MDIAFYYYYYDIVYNPISKYFILSKMESYQNGCAFGHYSIFRSFTRWSSFRNGNKLNVKESRMK